MGFFRNSTLLRPLSFLRIHDPLTRRYAWIYPGVATLILVVAKILFPWEINHWGDMGLLSKLLPILSVIFPFYVAALAAVATFKGVVNLDLPFPADQEGRVVWMEIMRDGGYDRAEITQRHYLSLLFGYCCIMSLILLLITCIFPIFAGKLPAFEGWWFLALEVVVFGGYWLFMLQLLVLTLVAVYFLSDKIHVDNRNRSKEFLKREPRE